MACLKALQQSIYESTASQYFQFVQFFAAIPVAAHCEHCNVAYASQKVKIKNFSI